MNLTPEQTAAAESTAATVYVEAGPGSGKTAVLVARVVWLVRVRQVGPARIRVFVFTRAAADEIRGRLALELGPALAAAVDVTTFHAFAFRIVAAHLRTTTGVEIEVASAVEEAAARDALFDPRSGDRLPAYARPTRGALEEAIRAYEARSRGGEAGVRAIRNRLLEAGLIPTWALVPVAIMGTHAALRNAEYVVPATHVLVDEAQDATPNDVLVATLLAGDKAAACSLFFVGDPRQAIFDWRGGSLESFGHYFDDAERHELRRTFRFGAAIAEAANRVAAQFGGAPIVGHEGAGGFVQCRSGLDAIESALADFEPTETAVLCRSNYECKVVVRDLKGRGVHVTASRTQRDAEDADAFETARREGLIPVATVHTAKGREWEHVVVPDSFAFPDGSPEDWRVFYVAATRARERLTLGRLYRDRERVARPLELVQ